MSWGKNRCHGVSWACSALSWGKLSWGKLDPSKKLCLLPVASLLILLWIDSSFRHESYIAAGSSVYSSLQIGRVVQTGFNRFWRFCSTASMVSDRFAQPGGNRSARNERIRIVAFQNIQNFENRISLRKITVSQKLKQNRKIPDGVCVVGEWARKATDYVQIALHCWNHMGSFVRIFMHININIYSMLLKT